MIRPWFKPFLKEIWGKVQFSIRIYAYWLHTYVRASMFLWGAILSLFFTIILRAYSENLCLTYPNQIHFYFLFYMFFIELDFIRIRKRQTAYPIFFTTDTSLEENGGAMRVRFLRSLSFILLVFTLYGGLIFFMLESQPQGLCTPLFYTALRFFLLYFLIQTLFLLLDAVVEYKDSSA